MKVGWMLERYASIEKWMDGWIDGGLMEMEYMNEGWVATSMEGAT